MKLIKRNSEYVPVYALDWIGHDLFNDIYARKLYDDNYNLDLSDYPESSGIRVIDNYETVSKSDLLLTIDEFLERVEKLDYDVSGTQGHTKYSTVSTAVNPNNIMSYNSNCKHYTKRYDYIYSNLGTLGFWHSAEVIPMAMMVVKRKYIPYFAKCLLLGEKPLNTIFEFWINHNISKDRNFPGVWHNPTSFVRHLKPTIKHLNKLNIKIVTKEVNCLLDELLPKVSKPKCNSLGEYKEWLKNTASLVRYKYIDPETEIRDRYNTIRKSESNKLYTRPSKENSSIWVDTETLGNIQAFAERGPTLEYLGVPLEDLQTQ